MRKAQFLDRLGGLWYCVDTATRFLRHASADRCYLEALGLPETGRVAIRDLTRITIADSGGIVWVSPRISWDGLRFASVSSRSIVGVAENGHGPEWDRQFEIDLDRLAVQGGHVAELEGMR
jgi:hypothetical protein